MISRRRLLSAALPLMIGSAALLRGQAARAQSTGPIKIGTILGGSNMAAFQLPAYLKRLSNLDAEIVMFPNITQRMQAVASGDIQIGYGGISAAIALASRDTPLTLLSNAAEGGWNLVASPKLQSLADLKNKKVAVQIASIAHLCLQWKLNQLGIADSVDVVGMDNASMPIAMQRGDLDALMAFEPYATFTVMHGWAKPLWLPYDTPMGRCNVGVVATPDYVDKYPDITRAILRAHKAATADLAKNHTLAIDAIVKTLNIDRQIVAQSTSNMFFTTDSGPVFHQQVQALGGMMKDAGMVQTLPDWSRFIDTRLIENA